MAIIAIKVHMSAAAFVQGPVFLSYPVIHEPEKRKGGEGALEEGRVVEGGELVPEKKKSLYEYLV